MTTPVIMLILLTGPYCAARLIAACVHRTFDYRLAAVVGLAMLFLFTASGHFIKTDPMSQMLPAWVPGRIALVHATGLLEIAIAVSLLVPRTRRIAGWVAALVLVTFFPVNIYAAFQHVPMGGHEWGPRYLLVRAPLQAAILAWTFWFTLRPSRSTATKPA